VFFAKDATTHATTSWYSLYLLYLYKSTNSGGAVTRGTGAGTGGTIPTLSPGIRISSHARWWRPPALRASMLATFFSSMPFFLLLLLLSLLRRLHLLVLLLLLLLRSASVLPCLAENVCNGGSSSEVSASFQMSEALRFAQSLALLRFCKAKILLRFDKRLDSWREVCGVHCAALHVCRCMYGGS
jgi:hypothetical protein